MDYFEQIEKQLETQGYAILSQRRKSPKDNDNQDSLGIIKKYKQEWQASYELLCDLVIQSESFMCFASILYKQLSLLEVNVGRQKHLPFALENVKEIRPVCIFKSQVSFQKIQKEIAQHRFGKKSRKYANKVLLDSKEKHSKEHRRKKIEIFAICQQKETQIESQNDKVRLREKKKLKFNQFSEKGSHEISNKEQPITNGSHLAQIEAKKQQKTEVANKNQKNSKPRNSKDKSKQSKKEIEKKQTEKQSKFLAGWISKSKTS